MSEEFPKVSISNHSYVLDRDHTLYRCQQFPGHDAGGGGNDCGKVFANTIKEVLSCANLFGISPRRFKAHPGKRIALLLKQRFGVDSRS